MNTIELRCEIFGYIATIDGDHGQIHFYDAATLAYLFSEYLA